MTAVRVAVASLVFLVVLVFSFVLSSRYLDDKFYYETLDKLLVHEEEVENALIVDFQRMLRIIDRHEVSGYEDDANICGL